MDAKTNLEITGNYDLCVRIFSMLEKRLKVHIKLHRKEGQIEAGQIFLFNHFARFETIIPQYLIHRETGAYCRSVAAAEFFAGKDDAFTKFLLSVGAVPNDHPRLLPFLAAEILRGRKVVVFPEGGMIKDRKVLDARGRYRIFSPTAKKMRKHHRGAAVIALTLEAFKRRILAVHAAGEEARLARWVKALGLEDEEALLAAARQPTLIVPANITFYPIRITDNILRKGVELFTRGISRRFSEELVIEGNILFKDTDMDIRLGAPIPPNIKWHWWERMLLSQVFRKINSLDDLFSLQRDAPDWNERLFARHMCRQTMRLRDACMQAMYAGVTVNLSHLAARMILQLVDGGETEVAPQRFHRALYLALKKVQRDGRIHLHRSLDNPERYDGIVEGKNANLERFLRLGEATGLISCDEERYAFLPKLCEEHDFHEIRLENPILVYFNEVAPVEGVRTAVAEALAEASDLSDVGLADLLLDDERRALVGDRELFSQPAHGEINQRETATESAEPYLLLPAANNGLGVLMVHGFLASPAEMRGLADKVVAAGHAVMGVRLKGHGTSPWDLRGREWEEWLASLRRGYRILQAHAERICLVGFSAGGALSLLLAAEAPAGLAGVVAISAPFKFRDKNLIFVPLIVGVNRLTRWVSTSEGIMPFRDSGTKHPHINYRSMPLRGLQELRDMVGEMEDSLDRVTCPVRIIQGSDDDVVDPESAQLIHQKLASAEKSVHMIPAESHGIVADDVGETHASVLSFLAALPPGPQQAGEVS